eukprot:CAMPEP_0173127518 /NCGR_PEP_ID=MMETSP1102-20130122/57865_1 /TAXON_ID=49646 /ORGANISM="Geminigera sp., Strain Caron Lab Isolate" /LENGTH=67 /DNA_ID=CAMNT_0014037203 /DNA_START=535 /DNA_END=738 /DNA_ORIENTATION=+
MSGCNACCLILVRNVPGREALPAGCLLDGQSAWADYFTCHCTLQPIFSRREHAPHGTSPSAHDGPWV